MFEFVINLFTFLIQAYDPQIRFDMPCSKLLMEDNAQGQGLSSAHEVP